MSRADFTFCHRFRVRYAEGDAQAIVFNSRYLEYADLVLTEYWRALGVNAVTPPFEVNVVRALVEYKKPIRVDEEIDGCIRTARIGSSSLTTLFELHGAGADDLRAAIETVHVHVDLAAGKSRPIPANVRRMFGG
ncbi:acyl-CoA thioesterase [Sphingobium boeckii]|uniref:Acyl-CoA thioester hydrolase n=1 Tax=Sphingobium boeckii TaxID=1082345 RepID=A0A7W9EEL3_9SPHN|nr:thioesterase family protein [Sphingobium boeckii]MBB5686297.1 acyl-CoA thioester hydrolase [Sphingobium boeckii]